MRFGFWAHARSSTVASIQTVRAIIAIAVVDAIVGATVLFFPSGAPTGAAVWTALSILAGPVLVPLGLLIWNVWWTPLRIAGEVLGDATNPDVARTVRRLRDHRVAGTTVTLLDCLVAMRDRLPTGFPDGLLMGVVSELGLRLGFHEARELIGGALVIEGVLEPYTGQRSLFESTPFASTHTDHLYRPTTPLGIAVLRALNDTAATHLPRPQVHLAPMSTPRHLSLEVRNAGPRNTFRVKAESLFGFGDHQLPYHVPWARDGSELMTLDHGESDFLLVLEVIADPQDDSHEIVRMHAIEPPGMFECPMSKEHGFLNLGLAVYATAGDILPTVHHVHLKWENGEVFLNT